MKVLEQVSPDYETCNRCACLIAPGEEYRYLEHGTKGGILYPNGFNYCPQCWDRLYAECEDTPE